MTEDDLGRMLRTVLENQCVILGMLDAINHGVGGKSLGLFAEMGRDRRKDTVEALVWHSGLSDAASQGGQTSE